MGWMSAGSHPDGEGAVMRMKVRMSKALAEDTLASRHVIDQLQADMWTSAASALGSAVIPAGPIFDTITNANKAAMQRLDPSLSQLVGDLAVSAEEMTLSIREIAVSVNEAARVSAEAVALTDSVDQRILAIQSDVAAAVGATGQVASVIATINEIQATVSAAVEEQSATTNEIGRGGRGPDPGCGRRAGHHGHRPASPPRSVHGLDRRAGR